MRMRPLLLRTSAAAAMHHATIRHGLRRLADLKHQMQGLLAHLNKLQQAAVSEQQSTAAAAAQAAWHSVTGATPGKQQHVGLASSTPGKLKVMARRQVCWCASASRCHSNFCLLVLCCLMLMEMPPAVQKSDSLCGTVLPASPRTAQGFVSSIQLADTTCRRAARQTNLRSQLQKSSRLQHQSPAGLHS